MGKINRYTIEGYSYFQRQPLSDKVHKYVKSQVEWPDVLRWKGSVFLSSLGNVIVMTLIACIICLVNFNFDIDITVPLSVLNTVSVALGLLLAFRVNTAYDRYWEGRKLIQAVIATIQSFTRQVWTNAPEETESDCLNKKTCIKLLLAFFISTVHHLREEKGDHYDDLKGLLPDNWRPACVQKSQGDLGSTKSSMNLHLDEDDENEQMVFNRRHRRASDGDVDEYQPENDYDHTKCKQPKQTFSSESDNPTDLINIRKSLITQEFHIPNISELNVEELEKFIKDIEICVRVRDEEERQPLLHTHKKTPFDLPVYTYKSHNKRKALYQDALKLVKKYESQKRMAETRKQDHSGFTCPEDLPYLGDSEICLPIEIMFKVTYYIKSLKGRSALLSSSTSMTDSLISSLTALERIVQTPIPRAYNIHLKQAVTLYIFFLPLALVESLGWLVTPIVAIASFTLFGILAIGEEIENPFGYDANDLPLLEYYSGLKKDVKYILNRIPQTDTLACGI